MLSTMPKLLPPHLRVHNPTFAALDFETANQRRDSACAIAIVRVEAWRIVRRWQRLIRPPSAHFAFSHIHGITWAQVARQPTFAQLWPQIAAELEGIDAVAAHSASFDRSVLRACCAAAEVACPPLPWVCTVALARQVFEIRPTRLPDVCSRLGIALEHHQALSDAEACARIVLAAMRERRSD